MFTGSSTPTRAHLLSPQEWGYAVGTDFYLTAAANGMLTAGNGHELSDYGWTTTSLGLANGSAADFMASGDVGTPGQISFNAASDLLQSPAIFGDYKHLREAQFILGYAPTQLCMEIYAAFTTAAANETATCFGLVEAGGSIITAGDANGTFFSDGTNFGFRTGAASDAGSAIDTAWHMWRAIYTAGGSAEWFIDGVSQGTVALQADVWPSAFGAGIVALGTNIIAISSVHLWYQ